MKKKWETKTKLKIKSEKLKVKQIIQTLLENRGLKTKKAVEEFLNPPSPYLIKLKNVGIDKNQLTKALARIKKAISQRENIVIYGDYDADGISATAVLWETLHRLKAKVLPFIPRRDEHGYGLSKKGIDSILKLYSSKTLKLLITVDNGIVAHQAVKYAQSQGIDVIITDHHQKKLKKNQSSSSGAAQSDSSDRGTKRIYDLPKAYSIIWSDKIAGAGVAWFLAREIYRRFHHDLRGFKASNALELACIGTVTDMMPVIGINRSLIKHGLEEIRRSRRPGIVALCRQAGIDQKNLTTYELGFIIGPRLNAMGRLKDALESLRLLCTNSQKRAESLAVKLGSTNRQRQQLTQATFEHAKSAVKPKAKTAKILFISDSSYNPGIIGLVAGKLVEEFYRPAIVISQDKEFSKGSVRSINGFNIIKALRKIKLFADLGGHPMAAGFTIKTSQIKELKEKIIKLAEKELDSRLLQPKVKIDLELRLNNLSWELLEKIEKLAPFGLANPRPVFALKKIQIGQIRTVGREQKHLKFQILSAISHQPSIISHQSSAINAIAFNLGYLAKKLNPGKKIDICFNLQRNVWNNSQKLQLVVKDIKA